MATLGGGFGSGGGGLVGSFNALGAAARGSAASLQVAIDAMKATGISAVDAKAKVDALDATLKADRAQQAADKQYAIDLANQHTKALQQNTDAQESLNASTNSGTDSIDTYGAAVGAANQTMKGFTPIWLTVTAATQAQTDALKALLQAQNAYSDSVANTLTVAAGWNDYLANLADEYKQGTIDILQYKNALTDFSTQLSQDFSGATGKARDAITSLQQAIQSLINSAGGGPSTPTGAWQSPTTQLNQAFNGP